VGIFLQAPAPQAGYTQVNISIRFTLYSTITHILIIETTVGLPPARKGPKIRWEICRFSAGPRPLWKTHRGNFSGVENAKFSGGENRSAHLFLGKSAAKRRPWVFPGGGKPTVGFPPARNGPKIRRGTDQKSGEERTTNLARNGPKIRRETDQKSGEERAKIPGGGKATPPSFLPSYPIPDQDACRVNLRQACRRRPPGGNPRVVSGVVFLLLKDGQRLGMRWHQAAAGLCIATQDIGEFIHWLRHP